MLQNKTYKICFICQTREILRKLKASKMTVYTGWVDIKKSYMIIMVGQQKFYLCLQGWWV